ncbi:copper resistance protein CopC [Actinoplanes sp. NPDC049265]|uniref:copper resistance CopC family protein n=1 Tax=Actinoplanes sp. NPDC049265 TaxID=3363902 RepID=UPI003718396C
MGRIDVRRLLAIMLVGVVAGSAAAPAPALAHGTLVTSTPAQGSTVAERIEAVTLTFTEKPQTYAYFTVTAPTGVRVDSGWSNGEPRRLAKPVQEYQLKDGTWQPLRYDMGFPVKVAVSHWPAPGAYVVTYHNVASDGDAVKGELRFTYHGAVTPPPPGWQAPVDQPKPELLAAAGNVRPAAAAEPSPQPRSAAAAPGDRGVWVWLVPLLLLVAAALCAVLVVPQLRRR